MELWARHKMCLYSKCISNPDSVVEKMLKLTEIFTAVPIASHPEEVHVEQDVRNRARVAGDVVCCELL